MIGHDQGNTAESVHQVPQRPQGLLGIEQRLRSRPAHREDHLRLHDVDLAEQIWHARCDLIELRSEEHTSELQSRLHLVCRLLLEKKKKKQNKMCNQITS